MSVRRQSELLGLIWASLYYRARPEAAEDPGLMRVIDREYTRHSFLGVAMRDVITDEIWAVMESLVEEHTSPHT